MTDELQPWQQEWLDRIVLVDPETGRYVPRHHRAVIHRRRQPMAWLTDLIGSSASRDQAEHVYRAAKNAIDRGPDRGPDPESAPTKKPDPSVDRAGEG